MVPSPLHRSTRLLSPLLAALCAAAVPFAARGTDWPVVAASYQQLEWIAGLPGESPDNGNEWNNAEGLPARQAELSEPHSAMADLAGNIYVADKNAHSIRRIAPDGILTTVAGSNTVGFNGDGPATARQLNGPQHAYVLPDGTLYVLDSGNKRVRKVDLSGNMTTLITDSAQLSRGLWVNRAETVVYYCTETALKLWTPAMGNGPGVLVATGFTDTGNIDVAANGDIYVADRGSSRVYRVPAGNNPANPPVPVAGAGGNASNGPGASGDDALTVGMREARGVAFHPAGGYFVATHRSGDIWYVDTQGKAWMFIEGDDNRVHFETPVPVPTTDKAVSEPRSVTVALNGDVLIATNDAGYIKRVRWTGAPGPGPREVNFSGTPASGLSLNWTPAEGQWSIVESSADPAGPWQMEHRAGPSATPLSWSAPAPSGTVPPRGFLRIRSYRSWPN